MAQLISKKFNRRGVSVLFQVTKHIDLDTRLELKFDERGVSQDIDEDFAKELSETHKDLSIFSLDTEVDILKGDFELKDLTKKDLIRLTQHLGIFENQFNVLPRNKVIKAIEEFQDSKVEEVVFSKMKVAELKKVAEQNEFPVEEWSNLKKADLIEYIEKNIADADI